MKKYTVILAAIAASALSYSAQATPIIYGSVGFGGGTFQADGDPSTPAGLTGAANITSVSGESIETGTGSFAALVPPNDALNPSELTPVFSTPISLAVNSYGSSGILLFTVVNGSDTYYFYDTATMGSVASYISGVAVGWTIDGSGYVDEYSGDSLIGQSYPGLWSIGLNATSGDSIEFQGDDSSPETVPDGGLTVVLLGGALVGLQAFRRKLFC